MAYLKISTLEYPLHEGDIRLKHPEIGEEFVLPDDYVDIEYVPHPDFDHELQSITEIAPILIDGKWTMRWQVNQIPDDVIAFRKLQAEERERAFKEKLERLKLEGREPDVIG